MQQAGGEAVSSKISSKSNAGFTLIELMIVVAIIGILATLAVSAYQTYTVRAQVAEGINMAAVAKTPVVDAYNNFGTAPANRAAAGMPADPTTTSGKYVSGVDISNGRIVVQFGGSGAHQDIIGMEVSLTPYITPGSTVIWRCGDAPEPNRAQLLNGGDAHAVATVDARYLPSTCRN